MKSSTFQKNTIVIGIVTSVVLLSIYGCAIGGQVLGQASMPYSVTKDAITWTFASDYVVGQYVNGDYFVIDPGAGVTVTSVSPGSTGSSSSFRNGSVVNPAGSSQGYDGRVGGYDSGQSVTFPITLSAGDSLVSTVSQIGAGTDVTGYNFASGHALVADASVLTVVSSAPSADSFRPPYVGTAKPTYFASSMNTGLLPEVSISSKPSIAYLANIADQFARPWLDHKPGWTGRPMHAINNMANYGREIGSSSSTMAALLMLDYTPSEKSRALINYVQTGIDLYWMSQTGSIWTADGGHANGRKWPILFAGLMLDDSGMKNVASGAQFGEDGQTYYGVTNSANLGQSKVAFWGTTDPDVYYQAGCTGGGNKQGRPSTLDDDACAVYRNCCTSFTWVGTAISVLLMDQKALWGHDAYFDYVDRWMGYGNDPQVIGGGGSGPTFIADMWNRHRSNL